MMSGNIGEKIRTVRKSTGLTQEELAKKAGIAVNSVRLYEAGKYDPKFGTLRLLADALNVPTSAFIEAEDISDALLWVSVKERLPELDEDEYFVQCLVSVVRWDRRESSWSLCSGVHEYEEVRPAVYDPEQKIFTAGIFEADKVEINALLDPDEERSSKIVLRVTHWMPLPKPFGVLKKED